MEIDSKRVEELLRACPKEYQKALNWTPNESVSVLIRRELEAESAFNRLPEVVSKSFGVLAASAVVTSMAAVTAALRR